MVPWGFIYSLPLAAMAFAVTFIAFMLDKNKPKFVWHAPSILIVIFLCWCGITTIFAINPSASEELMRFFKILLTVLMALMILRSKKHIVTLVAVIAGSIGFFSIKGGGIRGLKLEEVIVYGGRQTPLLRVIMNSHLPH